MGRRKLAEDEKKKTNWKQHIFLSEDVYQQIQHLSREEIMVLLTKGRSLFRLLKMTREAEFYLDDPLNGDIKEAIEKW